MLGIQTPTGVAFWTQRVELDGRTYFLRGEWNQRDGSWFLGMFDQDENVIFFPRRLVANWDLLRTIRDDRAPGGALFAYDTSGRGLDPGFEDLGRRVLLLYATVAEVTAERTAQAGFAGAPHD